MGRPTPVRAHRSKCNDMNAAQRKVLVAELAKLAELEPDQGDQGAEIC